MVLSRINKEVDYKESSVIDREDLNHSSSTYNIVFDNLNLSGGGIEPITIMFGKPKHTHSHKGIVFMYVYLVQNKQAKCPIGVYEMPESSMLTIMDDDGEPDPTKMDEPLLYSHVNRKFIDSLNDETSSEEEEEEEEENDKTKVDEKPIEDDIFTVKLPSASRDDDPDDVTQIDVNKLSVQQLPEETAQDARDNKLDYTPSPSDSWIVKLMRNKRYKIESTDRDDSIFSVLKHALEQVGVRVSLQKMRHKLASKATDELFQNYRTAFRMAEDAMTENSRTINGSKTILKDLKQRLKNTKTADERAIIVNEANGIDERNQTLRKTNKDLGDFIKRRFSHMATIKTFPEYKEYIQSAPRYKVDQWTLDTLKQIFAVEFIVFRENECANGALDYIVDCGTKNDTVSKPTHYILAFYDGNSYGLISYKGKKVLMFREVPYDIKSMIMNKYMEGNAGAFAKIQDFRNMISKLDIQLDLASEGDREGEIDNEVILSIQNNAPIDVFPGYAISESIPVTRMVDFITLSHTKDWRRRLDDSWTGAPFKLDNHTWASVTHYYNASKYKKGFPDFYVLFSLDSESDLSKDAELARIVGSKDKHELKPKRATIDPDFYGGRSIVEKESALQAKIKGNPDILNILIATRDAKITQYKRGEFYVVREDLMRIRDETV